jgi:6-phosphogluconate dehydrogenase
MRHADLGLVGLGVMGQNLALNFADHGNRVAVFNRRSEVTNRYLEGMAAGYDLLGAPTMEDLVGAIARPRRIMLMVTAGPAVDAVIEQLLPMLEPGDVIIDGGNSLYTDTARRVDDLGRHGIHFVGAGVSGGAAGARHGPSIMPGGSAEAWPIVKQPLQAVAAKVADGTPCCDWVGPGGAGHFVKMVHNGIEYGDMQVIAEAYHLLLAAGRTHQEMSDTFRRFGEGVLDSYLIDITAEILAVEDTPGVPLVTKILDAAGQKGTGKWTVDASMELAQPVTLIAEAVYARMVSARRDERVLASGLLAGPTGLADLAEDDLEQALYASKIVSYAQGFMLLASSSEAFGWDLDLGRIASLWREGCIIRAAFLDDITAAFGREPRPPNLLLDPFFGEALAKAQTGWRRVVAAAVEGGIPVPAYSSALAFYDGYRSGQLPANLIQAQRDYFGAHTYERVDGPRGEFVHHEWDR